MISADFASAARSACSTSYVRLIWRTGGAHETLAPSGAPPLPSGSAPNWAAAMRRSARTSGGMTPMELGSSPAKPLRPPQRRACALPRMCCANDSSPLHSTRHALQRRQAAGPLGAPPTAPAGFARLNVTGFLGAVFAFLPDHDAGSGMWPETKPGLGGGGGGGGGGGPGPATELELELEERACLRRFRSLRCALSSPGCHGARYVPYARGGNAYPVRGTWGPGRKPPCASGSLQCRPAPPVRTVRGRLVRVARTYPTKAPARTRQLRSSPSVPRLCFLSFLFLSL